MIVLDTNILSHLRKAGDPEGEKIKTAMATTIDQDFRITIVTVQEAIDGAVGYFKKAEQRRLDMVDAYRRSASVVSGLTDWESRTLAYDPESLAIFNAYPAAMRRVNKPDRRIAAIALRHGATLWTRNVGDFVEAPGLTVARAVSA